jgi:FkbM family methyltransferase
MVDGDCRPSALQSAVIAIARATPLNRGIFRGRVARLLVGLKKGPIAASFQGARFRLNPLDNPIEAGMLLNPRYNSVELGFLRRCLSKGGVFVDVGANVGLYSITLAQCASCVIAIEPGSLALSRLRANIAESGSTNVTVVPCAVGEAAGEAFLETVQGNLGGSRLNEAGGERIRVQPLLQMLSELGVRQISALKIDIEGNEPLAIAELLTEDHRALWPKGIVIEHANRGSWSIDCFELITGCGYGSVGATKSNTLFLREP